MRFDWRYIPILACLALVIGFGLQVYTPLKPETTVLSGFLKDPRAKPGWYYATVECIQSGNALDGYALNYNTLKKPINSIALYTGIEVTTLSRAKRRVHDAPEYRDADPLCAQADGFSPSKQSLISSLLAP